MLPTAPGKLTSPSQKFVRREQQEQMEACLALLPTAQRQREAPRLRFYDGLPVSDIVERTGRSETAVAGLLKRGLSGLRELMRNEQNGHT